MIITEEEAEKKWCPFVRNAPTGSNTDADGGRRIEYAWCIGSKCMAWCKVDQVGIGPGGEKRDRDMDGRTRWVDRGHCGLVGSVGERGK